LFGDEITIDEAREIVRKLQKRKNPKPKGNAAPIGSGPEGETCKSCKHSWSHTTAKRYWKCALVKPTRGAGTDIRLKWAACSRWESKV